MRASWYWVFRCWRMLARLAYQWVQVHGLTNCHPDCPECGGVAFVIQYWPDTRYQWDRTGIDPNGPELMCSGMAGEQEAYWAERWAEYHSGLL